MSDPSSESQLTGESTEDLLKYSTGAAPSGDDTVMRSASSVVRESMGEETEAAEDSKIQPINEVENEPATSAEPQHDLENLTEDEVRYRLFPLESGHPANSPLPDTNGIRLDHFRLEERIGTGGMGAVFRATDERLDRVVAIKVLSPSQLHQPDAITRFENEARSAARLDHENIARVFTFSKDKGVYFIAGEYVIGSNVRDMIQQQGRLDVSLAVNYTRQIANALNHTSAAGVVHRDIKPSNIIITPEGRAKLVDLGLARKESAESSSHDLTVAGTTLGTFDYIAPEQAKDPRNVDVRSDIYALGCTLYHMLTGVPPYPEGTVLQKLLDHQATETPNPTEKNPAVSPLLSQVVQQMMSSNPLERYLTPTSLIHDLEQVAASLGMPGRVVRTYGTARPAAGRKFAWESYLGWIIAGIVLILIAIGLDFFTNQNNPVSERQVEKAPVSNTSDEKNNGNQIQPVSQDQIPESSSSIKKHLDSSDPKSSESDLPIVDQFENKIENELKDLVDQRIPVNQFPSIDQEAAFHLMGEDESKLSFRSLEKALLAAESGQSIEIAQTPGGSTTVSEAIELEGKTITLRGVRGSTERPVLYLKLPENGSELSKAFFTLREGGALKLFNVDLHFLIPNDSLSTYSLELEEYLPTLFALPEAGCSLTLKGVSITLESTDDQLASVFQISKEVISSDITETTEKQPVQISIESSIIRSDTRIIELSSEHDLKLSIEDSVLATEESILHVTGNRVEVENTPVYEISLKQSTVLADQSFLTLANNLFTPVPVGKLEFETENNIFTTRSRYFSFLDYQDFNYFDFDPSSQSDDSEVSQDFEEIVSWMGNYNFFDRITRFRALQSSNAEPYFENELSSWLDYWKDHPTGIAQYAYGEEGEVVNWLSTTGSEPASQLTLESFILDEADEEQPAFQGSSDGSSHSGAPIESLQQIGFQLRPEQAAEFRPLFQPRRWNRN